MKVALVHDYLCQYGGAERVLEALQALFPEAPTFVLLYDKDAMGGRFGHREIRTSFLQKIPGALSHLRWLLPLMPTATECYDLSEYDVIISSSSAFSKGIITRPDAIHICYCHTPTRYLWSDTHSYVQELNASKAVKALLPPLLNYLRSWDKLSADRVDFFIANSETVKTRIKKYYGKESQVIFPPVDTHLFSIAPGPKDYYLAGGRLVPYKRFDLVVDAFNRLGIPLKIFGTGPMEEQLKKMAGEHIQFLGKVSDEERMRLFQNAIAFIHPQEEDFGITPVESMAAGRPVIALRRGGAVETVIDGVTGTFFDEQSWEELADTILHFDHTKFDPEKIRAHAETFSLSMFRNQISRTVEDVWNTHTHALHP
ncbi:MAG: glycosyltransferase [Patescibacteria group bacterium]|jgi:glycosyltransferase involved in cell wall biosynthesis